VVEDASWGVSEKLLFLAKKLSSEPIAQLPHPGSFTAGSEVNASGVD
jgi:hypothetical protein